jgi:tetratricopeptide (TPR) repeat protein
MQDYNTAQKDLKRAYDYNPYNRNVINDLASAYVFNNNKDKAIALYKEAARISPRFDEPKLNLVSLYIQRKQYDTASFWLNSILHDSKRRTEYIQMLEWLNKPK